MFLQPRGENPEPCPSPRSLVREKKGSEAFSLLFKMRVTQVFQLTPVPSRASVSPSVKEGLGRWGSVFWHYIG